MKKVKIISVGCLLILIGFVLFVNHFVLRIGYPYPDGEINFIGLTKEEVIDKIFAENLYKQIGVDGWKGRSFTNKQEALNDNFIIESNKWSVNEKKGGIRLCYFQILNFDKTGKVYKQTLKCLADGP